MKLQTGLTSALFAFGSIVVLTGCQPDSSASAKDESGSAASTTVAPKRDVEGPSAASNSASQLQSPIGANPGPVAFAGPAPIDPATMVDPATQLQASLPGPGDLNGPGSGPQGIAP